MKTNLVSSYVVSKNLKKILPLGEETVAWLHKIFLFFLFFVFFSLRNDQTQCIIGSDFSLVRIEIGH